MIATTINMHHDTLAALISAAARLNISRRDIIIHLLMRVMRDIDSFPGGFRTIQYQSDDKKANWHCFSIKFKEDENEFFSDLRSVCKRSVSLLVAIAVEQYLEEMLDEATKGIHNYKAFSCYMLQCMLIHGVICWQRYWGIPKIERTPQKE